MVALAHSRKVLSYFYDLELVVVQVNPQMIEMKIFSSRGNGNGESGLLILSHRGSIDSVT